MVPSLSTKLLRNYRNRDRIACEDWLDCAKAAIPACCRMLNFDRLVASCATFASLMLLSEALKLTNSELASPIAWVRRFSPAPTTPMTLPRAVVAVAIAVKADFALPALVMSALLTLAADATAAALLNPTAAFVPALSV